MTGMLLAASNRLVVLGIAAALLGGCTSFVEAFVGQEVAVAAEDATPPQVRIVVPEYYVVRPAGGDFVVTTEDHTAEVSLAGGSVGVLVTADDPEGVLSVELLDIVLEPTCARLPVDDGRPPPVPEFQAAPAVVTPGSHLAAASGSVRATTRLPLIKMLSMTGGARRSSRWCPADRPWIGNSTARLRARAVNFSGLASETAVATLTLRSTWRPPPGSGGSGPGGSDPGVPTPRGRGGTPPPPPEPCDGEGTPCKARPVECWGRGESWDAPGTVRCQDGEPVCVAESGRDYCTICGGVCGGCAGSTCRDDGDCTVGNVCERIRWPGGDRFLCRSLRVPEASTGRVPCTWIGGFCWLPSEVGSPQLGCREALE